MKHVSGIISEVITSPWTSENVNKVAKAILRELEEREKMMKEE